MKQLLCIIGATVCLVSCKKEPDPVIDYCGDAITEFKQHINYEGLFSFCNAQPPLQSFIPGNAIATFFDSNTVMIHFRADSISFDTTLFYNIHCTIHEKVIPSISLDGQTENDTGHFSNDNFIEDFTGFLHINFGYPNCLNNTSFEGLSKK